LLVFIFVLINPIGMRANQTKINDIRTSLGIIREKKGLTQSQLSKYSGLDLQYIQEIENGTIDPELVTILTIANTLEIDVKGLFDY
jgi:transcriptional regulator with XRE-family HTH domain